MHAHRVIHAWIEEHLTAIYFISIVKIDREAPRERLACAIERSAGVSARPGRHPEQVADYAAGAEALYAVGTRLFTVGIGGPKYDLGPIRDLVGWRDSRQAADRRR